MIEPLSAVRLEFWRRVMAMSDDECRVMLGLVLLVKSERGALADRARRVIVKRPAVLPASN